MVLTPIEALLGDQTQFGRLTLIGEGTPRFQVSHPKNRPGPKTSIRRFARCRCECGNIVDIFTQQLRSGKSKSCGCLRLKSKNVKHGGHNSPEYNSWRAAKARCTNPKLKDYPRYGGAGITMDKRWADSFETFLKDMGKRPSSIHTLDRYPDNAGNYAPGNCRWATPKEQAANRRKPTYGQ